MAGGRFELTMEPTTIGLVSRNSNSETHMTAICDARLIYGRSVFHGFICCTALRFHLLGWYHVQIISQNKPIGFTLYVYCTTQCTFTLTSAIAKTVA